MKKLSKGKPDLALEIEAILLEHLAVDLRESADDMKVALEVAARARGTTGA